MDYFESKTIAVPCSHCGTTLTFEGWPIIVNALLPEVTEDLRKGTLFENICQKCGEMNFIAYQCLYHDLFRDKLVLMQPEHSLLPQAIEILAQKTHTDKTSACDNPSRFTGRLVFHPDRLGEKVRIFEADLDDCAIELIKFRAKEHLLGDDVLFETVSLYFDHDDGESIVFYASGYEDGIVIVPRDHYEETLIDLMVHPPQIQDFIVDEHWAQRHFADVVLTKANEAHSK